MALEHVARLAESVRTEVGKAYVAGGEAVELLLIALLAQGNILLEGPPGVAKTLLVRAFAKSLRLDFGRIQFTPDLMPGDVVGTTIFNFQANEFRLVKGPVFTEVLLADEINRTPPKTQAALLEAMHERSVTIEGESHQLSPFFMTVATQNPIEHQGTYPLPEAQLDRFLFKHAIGYPTEADEREIIVRHGVHGDGKLDDFDIQPVADPEAITAARAAIGGLTVSDPVIDYVLRLVRATREHPGLEFGASPRAAAMLTRGCRAAAVLDGRDYVLPDDVKRLARPVLRHRVILAPAAEMEGATADRIVDEILDAVAPPR